MTDKKQGDMKTKRNRDIIMIAALLLAAFAACAFFKIGPFRGSVHDPDNDLSFEVSVDGEVVFSSRLSEIELPYEFEVTTQSGGYNKFIIDKIEGTDAVTGVRCYEADCPDKICVQTGVISIENELIVCLPHRVIARIY